MSYQFTSNIKDLKITLGKKLAVYTRREWSSEELDLWILQVLDLKQIDFVTDLILLKERLTYLDKIITIEDFIALYNVLDSFDINILIQYVYCFLRTDRLFEEDCITSYKIRANIIYITSPISVYKLIYEKDYERITSIGTGIINKFLFSLKYVDDALTIFSDIGDDIDIYITKDNMEVTTKNMFNELNRYHMESSLNFLIQEDRVKSKNIITLFNKRIVNHNWHRDLQLGFSNYG